MSELAYTSRKRMNANRTCFKKKNRTQELMFTLIIGAVNPDPMKGINMTPKPIPRI